MYSVMTIANKLRLLFSRSVVSDSVIHTNKKIKVCQLMNVFAAAAAAKLLQLCPTLCNPIDGSPPGSPVPGILQARTLGWVAISFSNAWKWKMKVKSLNRVWLLATPWTAAYQAPPSMGFSRQEYWSGVPSPSPHLRQETAIPMVRREEGHIEKGERQMPVWSVFF